MNVQPNQHSLLQQSGIAILLLFFMLLTRSSHALTSVALPDASLAVFLLGGILLRRAAWFVLFFLVAATIDFGAAAWNSYFAFCLTDAYWGLVPAYGVMWLGGRWLARQADAFALSRYLPVTLLTTFLAFVISTQTYYLFSGRFPNNGLHETIQHGWNYLPVSLGYPMMYFAMIWLVAQGYRHVRSLRSANS
ncbi:hypothetical protein SAMN05192560_0051 [Methylobacillus rhizosphaerae]|uniref:Rod shape-determining protein MreD n=1 Tax=Methylobacillus rhizosphaerae TaxID=551994 RepID=A0A238XNL2_9PROT|nr:hypothetical protein [Methylobacillus rhizosphaerae]SNR60262.1 hypothetical protein SAMN05192560_0051 [Methylobacillus rhizosphaerae]